ncbi:hypothetical protein BESB_005690 [Besnoitia besnoiti]|uniref:Protein kinase domain-containing protein n=1 Tax=Besnoitia besnoiti TaxID=94643 RepID=A0A2A9MI60_BESBE|nr:hypothetical protein BESB_005690 [Besnoitia besnoiti]PFH38228.1 hypothetical protein BESB_005690 [Besnoitia besnoiti]
MDVADHVSSLPARATASGEKGVSQGTQSDPASPAEPAAKRGLSLRYASLKKALLAAATMFAAAPKTVSDFQLFAATDPWLAHLKTPSPSCLSPAGADFRKAHNDEVPLHLLQGGRAAWPEMVSLWPEAEGVKAECSAPSCYGGGDSRQEADAAYDPLGGTPRGGPFAQLRAALADHFLRLIPRVPGLPTVLGAAAAPGKRLSSRRRESFYDDDYSWDSESVDRSYGMLGADYSSENSDERETDTSTLSESEGSPPVGGPRGSAARSAAGALLHGEWSAESNSSDSSYQGDVAAVHVPPPLIFPAQDRVPSSQRRGILAEPPSPSDSVEGARSARRPSFAGRESNTTGSDAGFDMGRRDGDSGESGPRGRKTAVEKNSRGSLRTSWLVDDPAAVVSPAAPGPPEDPSDLLSTPISKLVDLLNFKEQKVETADNSFAGGWSGSAEGGRQRISRIRSLLESTDQEEDSRTHKERERYLGPKRHCFLAPDYDFFLSMDPVEPSPDVVANIVGAFSDDTVEEEVELARPGLQRKLREVLGVGRNQLLTLELLEGPVHAESPGGALRASVEDSTRARPSQLHLPDGRRRIKLMGVLGAGAQAVVLAGEEETTYAHGGSGAKAGGGVPGSGSMSPVAFKLFYTRRKFHSYSRAHREAVHMFAQENGLRSWVPRHIPTSALYERGLVTPVYAGSLEGHSPVLFSTRKWVVLNFLAALPPQLGDMQGLDFGRLSANARVYIVLRLIQTVAGLHALRVLHLDIKPDNVLVGRDGRVFLADFGYARQGLACPEPMAVGGTDAYMAPEWARRLLDPNAWMVQHDTLRDAWAVAVTCYTAWCGGNFPYGLERIIDENLSKRDAFKFIAALEETRPQLSMQGCLPDEAHPFAREINRVLHAMLRIDPSERVTPMQIVKTSSLFVGRAAASHGPAGPEAARRGSPHETH